MRNRYAGNCENCGKHVPPKAGHWREIPKQTRNFTGLRCKFCGETIKKNIEQIKARKINNIIMQTKIVKKAPLCTKEEHLILNPPYTIIGSPSLPQSQALTMNVGGLKEMLSSLEDEDTFRIEWFSGFRASEFSFIKHNSSIEKYENS